MKVHEIMTAHARCVAPDNTLVEAAGLMRELDVGALPVCDNDRLAGMLTDRDLVVRAIADGRDPNETTVGDVLSAGVVYVLADQDVEDAARIMEEKQIRRLAVLSREKRLVGIVSLGDIATSSQPAFSGAALRDVSTPADLSGRKRRLLANAQAPAATGGVSLPAGTRAVPSGARRTAGKKAGPRKSAGKSRGRSGARNSSRAGQGGRRMAAKRGSRRAAKSRRRRSA
jgi:CBS domain-containing protein